MRWLVSIIASLFILGVGSNDVIYTTIPPLKGLVKAISPDKEIKSIIPEGVDPHHFVIKPSRLREIVRADEIIALTGKLELESKVLSPLCNWKPALKVINVGSSLQLIENDPHVWLSVKNLKTITQKIAEVLGKDVDETVIARLDNLDKRFQQVFRKLGVKYLLCFHPAWRYLARDYGLQMVSVMDNSGHVNPSKMRKLIERCKQGDFKFIFVEKQFDASLLRPLISTCNIATIPVNPLAEDIIAEFESVLKKLEKVANNTLK